MLWRYMVEDTLQIFRADPCHTAINLSLPNLLALRGLDLRLRTGVAGDLFFLNAIEHHLPKRRETVQRCNAGLTVPFQGWPEVLFNEIKSGLARGENVRISGFAGFYLRQKKERIARNPKTGELITIKARRVLTFKPSRKLLDSTNRAPNVSKDS